MPYENLYPPKNGGLQRCFNIFHQLTKYFDVTAVTHAKKENLLSGAKNYPSIVNASVYTTYNQKIPKSIFSLLPKRIGNALQYRWITKNFNQSADGSFLKLFPVLKKILTSEQFDFIVLENLSLTSQAKWIRKHNKKAQIIYNAYNVDSLLAQQAGTKNKQQQQIVSNLLEAETSLYKVVDGIFCCSQKDLDTFTELNNKKIPMGYVVPNGVDTTFFGHTVNNSGEQMKNIIFCGNLDYEPNKEGLLWFYKNVWPMIIRRLPDRLLYVIGKGNRQAYHELLNDKTVKFIGEVDEVTPWYRKCNIAIAPLMQGSGTRLKILEAMSLGNPVVTTTIGVEGIEAHKDNDVLVADDPAGFADKIIQLSSDPVKASFISVNARRLVENKYSWNIIGNSLSAFN